MGAERNQHLGRLRKDGNPNKRQAAQDKLEAGKSDVGWGPPDSQLCAGQFAHQGLAYQRGNFQYAESCWMGDLDEFIQASLKQGV